MREVDPSYAEEQEMAHVNAVMCIPYAMGYLQGLLDTGVLYTVDKPAYIQQFRTGMKNAIRDAMAGVIVVSDTEISRHLHTLIEQGDFPLTEKP
jgi:hypothetical protein